MSSFPLHMVSCTDTLRGMMIWLRHTWINKLQGIEQKKMKEEEEKEDNIIQIRLNVHKEDTSSSKHPWNSRRDEQRKVGLLWEDN